MSQKPSIYLDSNILSILWYRGGVVSSLAWHISTRDWWDNERGNFKLYASQVVEDELTAGKYAAQAAALKETRKLPYLPYISGINSCAQTYLDEKLVPHSKRGDALQLAFATIHRVDYLMTWNHAHLVNIETQRKLSKLNKERGWRCPLIVSPDTIPKAALGQSIWRSDEE
jgi:hypothetical protein